MYGYGNLIWKYIVAFLIKHFSDTVEYDVYGFLEKNRDTVSKELVNVLKASDMILVRKLMEIDDESRGSRSNTSLGGRVILSASKTQVFLKLNIYFNVCIVF